MKSLFPITIVFLFCPLISISQNLKEIEAIEINSKFKLEIVETYPGIYGYKLLSIEEIHQEINSSSAGGLLDDSLKHNEIQGVFAIGKFGDVTSTILVLKSGHYSPLDYRLFIDTKGRNRYHLTSTTPLSTNIQSIEVWPYGIHAIKISEFTKAKIVLLDTSEILDTTCYSGYDIKNGNMLFDQQLTLILDLITSQKNLGIDVIKKYEDSIQSISKSPWGWGNELNELDSNNRFIGTYINRKKIADPLVFEITECPYLKREVAYFASKKNGNIKFVVFKWSQKWVGGWQSRAFGSIDKEFRTKNDFIINSLNNALGSPIDSQIEGNRKFVYDWRTNEGLIAESYLYIDKYSRSQIVKIYLKDQ